MIPSDEHFLFRGGGFRDFQWGVGGKDQFLAPHQWNDKPKRGRWVIKPAIRDSELGRDISRRIYPPRFMLDRFIINAYLKDIMLDTD